MQTLFKTAYINVPPNLVDASYGELLSVMEKRQTLINDFHEAVYNSTDEDRLDDVLMEMDKSTFKSTVYYFTTLHEAICQAVESVSFENESNPGKYTIDAEPFEDHFEEVNEDSFEDIRAFIISEHPKIEPMSFPVEKVYKLGLPKCAPEPIDHGPTTVN